MKKIYKLSNNFLIICTLILGGAFSHLSAEEKEPSLSECDCQCHKKLDPQTEVQEKKDEKKLVGPMSMKEQEEYCSRPFREFLEEYGNKD